MFLKIYKFFKVIAFATIIGSLIIVVKAKPTEDRIVIVNQNPDKWDDAKIIVTEELLGDFFGSRWRRLNKSKKAYVTYVYIKGGIVAINNDKLATKYLINAK